MRARRTASVARRRARVVTWARRWAIAAVTSAAFVLDLSGSTLWVRRVLPVRLRTVTTRDFEVPTRHGPIAVRLYARTRGDGPQRDRLSRHPCRAASNEPRLAAFSRRLAATGLTVLSVPLPDLRRYRITPVSTDLIEDATLWMTADRTLAPSGRIGLVGVSFAGGLALVAAGRPSPRRQSAGRRVSRRARRSARGR